MVITDRVEIKVKHQKLGGFFNTGSIIFGYMPLAAKVLVIVRAFVCLGFDAALGKFAAFGITEELLFILC